MSKGSKPRPLSVTRDEFGENWERIFGKEKTMEPHTMIGPGAHTLGDDCPPAYNGCTCSCHSVPGTKHVAPCCYPAPLNIRDTSDPFYRGPMKIREGVPNKLAGIPASMTDRLSWDQYFVMQAMLAAAKSKDDSTWVGVVLVKNNSVIATGFNGFPRGVREEIVVGDDLARDAQLLENDPERWEKRPDKYRWVEHAERNAIYQAARAGISTEGSVMYMNTAGQPCSDCSRAIIQAGVVGIVTRALAGFKGLGEGTHYHCGEIERTMFEEAGIWHRYIPDFAPDYRYTSRD